MATLPTSAEVTEAGVTNAQQKTYFGNLMDFLLDLLGSDSSNKPAARAALGAAALGVNADITFKGNNSSTIYTTGGTSTAYTITPSPVYAAYAAGMSAMVNFNAASGAAPTIAWNGIATPPNLVKRNADGSFSNIAENDIPIGWRSRVTLISATQAIVEKLPSTVTTGTAVATTSGTAATFTGILARAQIISFPLSLVSTGGTSIPQVQVGTSGGFATSGYDGIVDSQTTGGGAAAAFTTGLALVRAGAAVALNRISGRVVFERVDGNTWSATFVGAVTTGSTAITWAATTITLGGELDRIRITTVNGTDVFDLGSVNIHVQY